MTKATGLQRTPTAGRSPTALPAAMQAWLQHLRLHQRYATHTLEAYERDLAHLVQCLPDTALQDVRQQDIRRAVAQLHKEGLHPRSLARALAAWRGFFQWWAPQVPLADNPAKGVKAPRAPRPLPRVLSVEQAQALLDRAGMPAPQTPVQHRDQAMFEILYSSGLRLAELVALDYRYHKEGGYESTSWLELDEAQATVRGKGDKVRQVPLGRRAIAATQAWLTHRPSLMREGADQDSQAALFLGVRGARIAPRIVQRQLEQLAQQTGLAVHVHPHSLRHSVASHLLQSAQDLRAVQEFLGHAHISTTQIYTQLDFQHLAQAYDKAHPRANRRSK